MQNRFKRLAALTQGAALVGSLGAAGCDKSQAGEPTQPPIVNAPPTPPATASAPVTDDTTGAVPTRRLPIPNAPPGRIRLVEGDAGGSAPQK